MEAPPVGCAWMVGEKVQILPDSGNSEAVPRSEKEVGLCRQLVGWGGVERLSGTRGI